MDENVPIPTLHLIREIDALGLELLRGLNEHDWILPTLAKGWMVRDIAAHLLDGNVRSLSMSRDKYFGVSAEREMTYENLVAHLAGLNKDWVNAMRRVSPQMLISLLETTNVLYQDHLASLPPFEAALFPVAWAGQSESPNWFHIAREYTEKWHHQQQIRQAAGLPSPLFQARYYSPYIRTSFMALPYHFRDQQVDEDQALAIHITGEGGGTWYLRYHEKQWMLEDELNGEQIARTNIDGYVLWRIFSAQIDAGELSDHVSLSGNSTLAERVLSVHAVMV